MLARVRAATAALSQHLDWAEAPLRRMPDALRIIVVQAGQPVEQRPVLSSHPAVPMARSSSTGNAKRGPAYLPAGLPDQWGLGPCLAE
ncbi:MAG: hypothetical protein KF771_13295 [Burkholderiales bacterium]|nr:hypothetical protein [Burkholderiales bacterium]